MLFRSYFHLDHVAVSLAASRAVKFADKKPDLFLFNHFSAIGQKDEFGYHYIDGNITHISRVDNYLSKKIKAINQHQSQIGKIEKDFLNKLKSGNLNEEEFELVNINNSISYDENIVYNDLFITNKIFLKKDFANENL